MHFRSRDAQTSGIASPLYNLTSFHDVQDDRMFDGVALPRTSAAVRWIKENTVHQALKLTASGATSAPFLSTQVSAVRDEGRDVTHVLTAETDGLYLSKVQNVSVIERHRISDGVTSRHTLELRKYDGGVVVAYVEAGRLHLGSAEVGTTCQRVDFPCLSIDQPPIGHVAVDAPTLGLLSYKCRESNSVYVRTFNPVTLQVGPEVPLRVAGALGSADVVCRLGRCFIRVDVAENARIRPFFGTCTLNDLSNLSLTPLNLDGVPHDELHPATCRSFIDYTENYHTILLATHGQTQSVIDVMPHDDLAVAAITLPNGISGAAADAFPKKPGAAIDFRPGFGNGVTDGNGIIISASSKGELLSTNSQSGGYSYPEAGLLNHEMPKIFAFRTTQCYTRGAAPNTVSMDYIFIEADDQGNPVDSTIWLETWDMPLPLPDVQAISSGNSITLNIQKDGWFFPGKTTVGLSDLAVSVVSTKLVSDRTLEILVDRPPRAGSIVSFEMKSQFLHHAGEATLP
ncbi:hypothetical protein [Bradyrhizobium sp.]|uniref:hypothetical protein n=1 Tax=Bradyrhizobium sp. TaxID=376 RepID=UPI0039E26C24